MFPMGLHFTYIYRHPHHTCTICSFITKVPFAEKKIFTSTIDLFLCSFVIQASSSTHEFVCDFFDFQIRIWDGKLCLKIKKNIPFRNNRNNSKKLNEIKKSTLEHTSNNFNSLVFWIMFFTITVIIKLNKLTIYSWWTPKPL